MASKPERILLGVRNDNIVKLGLPPKNDMDRYNFRSLDCGTIVFANLRHMFCSPDGELYCIRDSDLYAGPLPSRKTSDWFSECRRVGQHEWGNVKLLCFDPQGALYAVTHEGNLYKGSKPVSELRSWLYGQASIMGRGGWQVFETMFFDSEGSLYAVKNDDVLLKGPRPETTYNWLQSSKIIGQGNWLRLCNFMSLTSDGKLWCVDKNNGNFYRGDIPTSKDKKYLDYAQCLGNNYHLFKFCFTQDKTIHNIINLEFLPEEGKKTGEYLEVLAEEIYDNRNSTTTTLKHTFSFEKKITESSCFTHEHGFTFDVGVDTTVKGGIPFIGEAETTLKVNASTTNNWQFTESNQKETTLSRSTEVEVGPGHAVKVKASVMTADIICPYEAEVVTLFGNRTRVKGTWKGSAYYNLRVTQKDYDGL